MQSHADIASPESALGWKPFRESALRQSIAVNDAVGDVGIVPAQSVDEPSPSQDKVVSPPLPDEPVPEERFVSRVDSLKKKLSRPKSSSRARLSFGPGEIISGDAAEALEEDLSYTPKKSVSGRRLLKSSTARQSLSTLNRGGDEERPTYSRDYLNELKSSTPATPKNLSSPSTEEKNLDPTELDGAVIVDMPTAISLIPTDAEVRERKERRARLAREQEFISLDSGPDDDTYSLLPRKKATESRLVREDEDIAEGFDEFVQDGSISLGLKAEREAKRRQRKEMATLIQEAEGSGSDASDDSEAARRAAYESAQTRAGMDGLHYVEHKKSADTPLRVTPLPKLDDCLKKLQGTLNSMQLELKRRQLRLKELEMEKEGIERRESEVQRLVQEAGDKYSTMKVNLKESDLVDRGVEGALTDASVGGI